MKKYPNCRMYQYKRLFIYRAESVWDLGVIAGQDRDNVIDIKTSRYNDKVQKIKNASMQTKTAGQKQRQKEGFICM